MAVYATYITIVKVAGFYQSKHLPQKIITLKIEFKIIISQLEIGTNCQFKEQNHNCKKFRFYAFPHINIYPKSKV